MDGRENIHHILYRLVMTSYIYSLVMWPPCQHTKGLLVGPLPWKKSGRETGKKCEETAREEEQEGFKAVSSLQRYTRLGLFSLHTVKKHIMRSKQRYTQITHRFHRLVWQSLLIYTHNLPSSSVVDCCCEEGCHCPNRPPQNEPHCMEIWSLFPHLLEAPGQ